MTNPNFERGLAKSEQVLARAKEDFRITMLSCDPFAELVVSRLTSKDRQGVRDGLPEFGCEPWRFRNDKGEGNGYGVRLSFSLSAAEEGLGVHFSTLDYIKFAELKEATLCLDPLAETLKATVLDKEAAAETAMAIGGVYVEAFMVLQQTEIPGDALAVDPMSGVLELKSVLDRTTVITE